MFALILKDLRSFTNTRKYLLFQFIVIAVIVFLFMVATIEFYAQAIDTNQSRIPQDVGKQTYTVIVICIFISLFHIPKHAVELVYLEGAKLVNKEHGRYINIEILMLSPLANWKIVCGKIAAIVIWTIFGICLTIPIFALSMYIGGLTIIQLVKCGTVFTICSVFFAIIGIAHASLHPPNRAIGISYGVILSVTFLPLLPISPFAAIPLFEMLSPISALLSILQSPTSQSWIWNNILLGGLSLFIFPILIRNYR
ncbi:MAG: hypothetical protein OXD54_17470 [Candidatus Poribacteria bacterium]|nr:hypothetical protein [Candidatus Poribacteria bacterium]